MYQQGKLSSRQIRALAHPIRSRIVELYAREAARSLAVMDLANDLGDDFDGVRLSQVSYHLRHLQHLELIPSEAG